MENNTVTEKEYNESGLKTKVEPSNELKEWLVSYCGKVKNPENDEVTTEMIVEVIAEQFPEFLVAVAEENWIRGYHQALTDVEEGEKMLKNESDNISDEEWVKGYKKCKNCE